MSPAPPSKTAVRVSELSQNATHRFDLRPDSDELATIAATLGFSALRKVSFVGALQPVGKNDWELTARLGATVVQPCVVTLEPVTTRMDHSIRRAYLADFVDPDDPEAEMPEDDTSEALGIWIDPGLVMVEAISIAAPDFPRKEGAELGQMVYAEPGTQAMTDEDARPFAGLADLRKSLENGSE